MKIKLFLLGCGLGLGMASSGFAATATGTINVTLVLTNGCLINGQPAANGTNLGALDFGSSPAIFTTLNATLTSTVGTGIYVRCTTGATPTVQITGSTNVAPTDSTLIYGAVTSSPRYLKTATDTTRAVAYTLYATSSGTTPIANNTNLAASGTASATLGNNYPIFGRIDSGGNNPLVPAGSYTDTINVLVTY